MAMEIVRELGMEAVTARELGKRLGSSARPISTLISFMILYELIMYSYVRRIKKIFLKEIMSGAE